MPSNVTSLKIDGSVSNDHPELRQEQDYLDHAYERVDELRAAAHAAMEDVLDLGRGGTFQARTERDVVVRNSLVRLDQLDIGRQPLCFGRIDDVGGERFYIGRMGVSGRNQEPLIVDWRAPIAEPFYRATGRFPMGLARRRHFIVKDRKITGIEDEPLVLTGDAEALPVAGHGALLAALERRRSGRMQDIVATIQGEQDEVIRSPLAGVLVVQGGPGTGKTAVGLHRAAYLLYTHRFPLERQGVLVVGPNPIFLRYIGHVLPSLGESGVTLSTISGLVAGASVRGADTPATAAIKGDRRMVKVIERAIRSRERPLRKDVAIGFGSYRLWLRTEETKEVVAAVRRRGGTHNQRRKRIERVVVEHLFAQYVSGVERRRHNDASVKDVDLEQFSHDLKGNEALVEALDRMWPRLHAAELVHDLLGARPLIDLATKGVLRVDEAEMLYRPRSASIDEIPWTDADMALLDEAKVLLGPVRTLPDDEPLIPMYGHVVVDEAQDLSPMQLRMLGRRSIGGSMTIVGDIAQATGPWAPSKWADVIAQLPSGWQHREVELTIGYRTPAEAMQLAASVLEQTGLDLIPPRPVRSADEDPVFVSTSDSNLAKEVVTRVQGELVVSSGGSIGVVAPQGDVETLGDALGEAGVEYGPTVDAEVTLLPSNLAKGLEFDSVIVVEPRLIAQETTLGMRSLYVALTRTTQRLTLVYTGELPGYLQPDGSDREG